MTNQSVGLLEHGNFALFLKMKYSCYFCFNIWNNKTVFKKCNKIHSGKDSVKLMFLKVGSEALGRKLILP